LFVYFGETGAVMVLNLKRFWCCRITWN